MNLQPAEGLVIDFDGEIPPAVDLLVHSDDEGKHGDDDGDEPGEEVVVLQSRLESGEWICDGIDEFNTRAQVPHLGSEEEEL